MVEITPIGIPKLDQILGGGLPKGSIVVVAGCPGSGKTLLAAKFIYEGATVYGERGVYTCLTEPKDVFIRTMKLYGWDFEELENDRRVEVLDLSIGTELDSQSALNKITMTLNKVNAERFVIDSITALSVSLKDASLKRHMIRLLYRILRKMNCTSLFILETPLNYSSFGSTMEEFIADGIIHLNQHYNDGGNLVRTLRVFKMRGVMHGTKTYEYRITDKGVELL
ncbi:MAG: ATPase domain-containing protein [Candidatus Bathyarchaeia archaeon]